MNPAFIDVTTIQAARDELRKQWHDSAKPFRYLIFDGFFTPQAAEEILAAYPAVSTGEWNGTTYINQRNKFVLTRFKPDQQVLQQVFDELNSSAFCHLLEGITDIRELQGDAELFGGGLHQSTTGAFLDVHVDFNYHHVTKAHRRLNVIVYMNKAWQPNYNGHLELWDMQAKRMLERIEPSFNRCVVFETNEVSFHGHPKPLATPPEVTRKSIAVYYYTETRPEYEVASEHNTIYVNTEGTGGLLKNLQSGLKAAVERIGK